MMKLTVTIDNQVFDVQVGPKRNAPGEFELIVDGQPMHVYVPDYDKTDYADWMLVDNRPYELNIDDNFRSVQIYSGRFAAQVRDQEILGVRLESGDGRVKGADPWADHAHLGEGGDCCRSRTAATDPGSHEDGK